MMRLPIILQTILSVGLVAIALFGPAQQVYGATKEIQSCYDAVRLDDVTSPGLQKELFVLVDQTIHIDKKLQEQAYQKILKFLTPGSRIVLVNFSAYVADRYTEVLFDGVIDTHLSDDQRYSISKKQLRLLDKCLIVQDQGVRRLVGESLLKSFEGASSDLPNTELIGNLALLGKDILATARTSNTHVLVISDMLENSSVTSFYKSGSIRRLDSDEELDRVQSAGLITDFKDSRLYVLGAGYIPNNTYRSPETMRSIEAFWRAYFKASNAELMEFGMPSLIGEIGQ